MSAVLPISVAWVPEINGWRAVIDSQASISKICVELMTERDGKGSLQILRAGRYAPALTLAEMVTVQAAIAQLIEVFEGHKANKLKCEILKQYGPMRPELVTAERLFDRISSGQGHVCRRGMAPEGLLEIHPSDLSEIWLVTADDYAHFEKMCDSEVARRKGVQG